MQQTWRWFGPDDKVSLWDARQAGAEGIVTALHEVTPGDVWTVERIQARQREVEAAGTRWLVVESLEVTERIKARSPGWKTDVEHFTQSLRNLARCGIRTVAYNFMPVFSWMRTDLHAPLAHGGFTTRFDAIAFAAFDLLMLRRKNAEFDWTPSECRKAHELFARLNEGQREDLQTTILQGLPGGQGPMSFAQVSSALAPYGDIDSAALRSNAAEFLRAVCPVAQEVGIRLAVHPDDPPRPLLGLPRIVSTADDLQFLLQQSLEPANGITFCTGALGVRADNDLSAMAQRFAGRIHFAHLRSTQRESESNGGQMESFFEASHLEGDADLIDVLQILLREETRRSQAGQSEAIPFRADHGQELLDDRSRGALPGYPAVGRLRGLAELRGALKTLERLQEADKANKIERDAIA